MSIIEIFLIIDVVGIAIISMILDNWLLGIVILGTLLWKLFGPPGYYTGLE